MNKLALVFVCAFCASHGRRVHSSTEQSRSSPFTESNGQTSAKAKMDAPKALSKLLLANRPAAAFSPAAHGARLAAGHRSLPTLQGPSRTVLSSNPTMSVLDPIKDPLQAYADIWVPGFKWAQEQGIAPDFLIHWGHPAAMATVLLTMATYGTYLGWQTRLGNGGSSNILTLGDTFSELHPKLMGGAFFFFFLGGQGGLVLTAVQGKPILESTHATTAFLGLFLLTLQALLPTLFSKTGFARSAHAYLGTATMAVLFGHMAAGLNLGASI